MERWLRYLRSRKDYVRVPFGKMVDYWTSLGVLGGFFSPFVIVVWCIFAQMHYHTPMEAVLYYGCLLLSILWTLMSYVLLPYSLYYTMAIHVATHKRNRVQAMKEARIQALEQYLEENQGESGGGI